RQGTHRGHARHMRELGARFVQRILGNFARRHILYRSDEHGTIGNPVCEPTQMLDDSGRRHNPKVEIWFGACQGSPDRTLVERNVFRMDNTPESLNRHERARFEVTNAVELVGPVVLVMLEIRRKTACLTETLRLSQMVVRAT